MKPIETPVTPIQPIPQPQPQQAPETAQHSARDHNPPDDPKPAQQHAARPELARLKGLTRAQFAHELLKEFADWQRAAVENPEEVPAFEEADLNAKVNHVANLFTDLIFWSLVHKVNIRSVFNMALADFVQEYREDQEKKAQG